MMSPEDRHCVEINALVLGRARRLLDRAHSQLFKLIDIPAERTITRIITIVETERQRWLRTVDSHIP